MCPTASGRTPSDETPRVERLLEQIAAGGGASPAEQLLPLVYAELRRIASSLFRGQRGDHTLQPTALVHEAYARMVRPGASEGAEARYRSRAHFMAVAARAMRQILANHARDRRRLKRGGAWSRLSLQDTPAAEPRGVDIMQVDEALDRLAALDERQVRIVELRFFADLSVVEIAQVTNLSVSTVEREWRMARAWLAIELGGGDP